MQVFLRRYVSLSFYPINMKFGHDIPRVVRHSVHPSFSSGSIQDLLDHYVDQCWFDAVHAG